MADVSTTVAESSPERRTLVWTVVVTAAVWLLFSSTMLLLPVRWFVTLVHEAGHALATLVLGGDVHSLTINHHGGGLTMSSFAGKPSTATVVVVASAGYLGASIVGGLMIELSTRLRRGRIAGLILAALVAAIGLAWVPWNFQISGAAAQVTGSSDGDGRFTVLYCSIAVGVLVALALQPWERLRRSAVVALATCLCLASIDDLRQVMDISSLGGHSDAATAASVTPLSSWVWSALWLVLGAGACAAGLWSALSHDAARSPAAR